MSTRADLASRNQFLDTHPTSAPLGLLLRRTLLALCACALGNVALHAQVIWDGGGANDNFGTAANWDNNTAPSNPSGSVLRFAGSTRLTPSVNSAWTVNGIQFDSGASAFTIGGANTLSIRTSSGIANLDDTTQTITAPVILQANQTWLTSTTTGGLNVNATVSLNSATLTTNANTSSTITINGTVSGLGGLTVATGTGTTTLTGSASNTFTGTTTVNAGTLQLSKTAGNAVAANIVIGDGTGTDTLRLGAANQIADTSRISFNAAGTPTFDLNGFSETIGGLSSANTGAVISLGAGTLTVGSASNNLDSSFSGTISGSGGLTKAGLGTLTLTGNNSYTGTTTVSAGTLKLGSAGSGSNTPLGTTGGATTVSANATFDVNGFTLATAEGLTINGFGVGTAGALVNTGAGAATYSGAITLGSATAIGGTTGLTLSGIIGGAQALTKTGNNVVTLTGANTNSSSVTVRGGNLTLSGSGTMLSATSFAVSTGGNLVLDNTSTNNGNRIGTGAFSANGGGLYFTHNGAAGTNYAETMGTVTYNTGHLDINLSQAASGQTSRLTIGGLTRGAGGTVLITGTGYGTTRNELYTTGALTATNNILRGAVIFDGTTYNLVTPVGANSVITAFTTYQTGAQTTWTANTVNARPSADVTLSAARSLNSLVLDNGIDLLGPTADRTLTFGTAAMILQTGGSSTIGASGANDSILAFGGNQATLFTVGNLTLQTGGANNLTGTAGIIKSGAGTFTNQAVNANTGTTVINQGTWRAEVAGAVSGNATTGYIGNGGVLELANNANTTFSNTNGSVNRNFTIRSDRTSTGAGTSHTIGTIGLNNGANLEFAAGGNVTSGTAGISTGAVTLGASSFDSTITANGTNIAVTLASIAGTNRSVTIGGSGNTTVTGVIGTGTGNLTKTGSGTLTLSGVNTYTGATTINGGTVSIAAETGLGGNPGAFNAGQLTLNGGTLATTATLAIAAANRGVILGASGGTFSPSSGTTLTVSNAIAGPGQLTKSGTGNLTLTASNTFEGGVNIPASSGVVTIRNANSLGLGSAGTTVGSGSALVMDSTSGLTTFNNNGMLTVSGTGVGSGGVLSGAATGSNAFSGNITLAGNSLFATSSSGGNYTAFGTAPGDLSRPVVDATSLSLGSNTLTIGGGSGSSIVYMNSQITGTGAFTVNMTNTADSVYLTAHQNTFTGLTTIAHGTLLPFGIPNTYPGDSAGGGGVDQFWSITGNIQIGDGAGAANTAILEISDLLGSSRTNELINFKSRVTMYADGQLKVNSAQTFGGYDATFNPGDGTVGQSFIFNGGTINIGTNGALYLMGDVKVNATADTTVTINGVGNTLSLTQHQGPAPVPNADRKFDVERHASSLPAHVSDLTINAKIMNGSITKLGNGTMTITGNNTGGYEGTTTINNGILAITHEGALGQGLSDAASGTRVNSGGTLRLVDTLTLLGATGVENENLYLNGTGFNPGTGVLGALQHQAGTNTWAGTVILETASSIQSSAGLLTLSGAVTSATNSGLTIFGSGNTTISGAIGTGSGTVTKQGSGTLILSGSNTYSGLTTVSEGVLSVQNNNALGSASAGTVVSANAALQLSNVASGNLTTLAEPLTLNGLGVGGSGGALRNIAGNNNFQGPVTIASTARINSDANTMTLSGGITSSNIGLTIGGAGNTTVSNTSTSVINLGTGSLTKDGAGTLTFTGPASATGTVGAVNLSAGNMVVGTGSTLTLGTAEFASSSGTTLTIASGGTVNANYGTGTETFFSGDMAGSGTFTKTGAGTLVFNAKAGFDASSLSLVLSGGTVRFVNTNTVSPETPWNGSDPANTSRFQFGTIYITGNTILDFNNSAGTFLSSANLVISPGVTVTVNNWISVAGNAASSTIWYATNASGGISAPGGVNAINLPPTQVGTGVLPQIVFSSYSGLTTTWVSGTPSGWFDREIRPTPEPATYGALFLGSCFGLIGWRRYRKRKSAGAPR